ncbi:MAG: Gldg family protein [Phycisphaeraceae bacterium]
MTSESNHTLTGPTQAIRRTKYGLNVSVAVVVAVLLVVLINWIFESQVRKLPPGAHRLMRYDLTATRQYSLSKQTVGVLRDLRSEVRIVTLIGVENPYTAQARDLIDEYARYSASVTIRHFNPVIDEVRLNQFYQTLTDRYASELQPLVASIERGRGALDDIGRGAVTQLAPLRQVLEDPALQDAQQKQFIQSVAQTFARFDPQIDAIQQNLAAALDHPMPDYSGARQTLQTLLTNLSENVYAVAADQFRKVTELEDAPSSVRERLLGLIESFTRSRRQIDEITTALRDTSEVPDYDKVRRQVLSTRDTVIVIDPQQVRVIAVADMFRDQNAGPGDPNEPVEPSFLGEELLTGALVSMTLDPAPMIVFVQGSRRAAIGPGGAYESVAQRLRNMDFDVQQWNPSGTITQFGQSMPPSPPPEPKPQQKAVWVILPFDPPDPRNPLAGSGKEAVVEQIEKRLAVGDGVLVSLTINPATRFGQVDPIGQMLEPWGITPQLDRIILREVILPDRRSQPVGHIEVTNWPSELPVTAALAGMPGIFVQASPLVLGDGESKGVQLWPLAEARGERQWAERNLQNPTDIQYDPSAAADSFVIAAAAQRDNTRLIVVADPLWASDQITTYGPLGPGTAPPFGAVFPANAELFVNSVYWLAGLDQLIAASARTQDIRRVAMITPAGMVGLRWGLLAGMPIAIAAVGCGVWLVRRKG